MNAPTVIDRVDGRPLTEADYRRLRAVLVEALAHLPEREETCHENVA